MDVARATSSPMRSSIRRSTPAIGEATQASRAAWTTTRCEKSALSSMAVSCRRLVSLQSLKPRAVAVDVVGGAGEAGAVAADYRFEGFIETAVVDIGSKEPVVRGGDALAQPFEIDGHDAPVVDDETAA